jgi:hypothetical protein
MSSFSWERDFMMVGRRYLEAIRANPRSHTTFATIFQIKNRSDHPVLSIVVAEITNRISIAIISCTMRIPNAILP